MWQEQNVLVMICATHCGISVINKTQSVQLRIRIVYHRRSELSQSDYFIILCESSDELKSVTQCSILYTVLWACVIWSEINRYLLRRACSPCTLIVTHTPAISSVINRLAVSKWCCGSRKDFHFRRSGPFQEAELYKLKGTTKRWDWKRHVFMY